MAGGSAGGATSGAAGGAAAPAWLKLADRPSRALRVVREGDGPTPAAGADRRSRLTRGTALVHADLHNHTLLSDGAGDPELAFASMRGAGLDVAALTDHAWAPEPLLRAAVAAGHMARGEGPSGSLDPAAWARVLELADAADEPGAFTALPGFEWTTPRQGHINVWGTRDWTPVRDLTSPASLYEWLERSGGLASFNHPGREPGRFEDFRYEPRVHDQLVGLELFNRYDDFLFEGVAAGRPSPLVACLEAGWRPGLTGVTDEHGDDWGVPEGKGRTGMWVTELSRRGVLEALRARRVFATTVSGLRLDATADAGAGSVRMGGVLRARRADVRIAVDVDRGPAWEGVPLAVQVLRPGPVVPRVVDVVEVRCGSVAELVVPLDLEDGAWVVLRVSDPARPGTTPAPPGHPCQDRAVAYGSPWWLEP